MKVNEYPPFTVIMRNYSFEQVIAIAQAIEGFEKYFAIEVTLNTTGATKMIHDLVEQHGTDLKVGAGTVITLDDAKEAIKNGAQFLLGPKEFTSDIFSLAKEHHVVTVPAGMTPTEIVRQIGLGADIVKVFPATTVRPDFFKAVQAPLGKLRLMAVGGVSASNAKDFLNSGADYLGIGSSMFTSNDLNSLNKMGLRTSLEQYIKLIH
ncbi:bifunctional 4-hydroxy-2-oxoglutarate aldolase/2-dehydro-3-deoxy-phosphogluconate aldolase [Xylocopilactobacillus apis]|uniref:2-dehydro-3-deoxyphosphooctonate aldolase n=1 Tax=Xylocopilactobacillus apis TaxID=2932183 RepID=A0AAU9DQN4_9LACO|nr:bifunctional 4-hydroxy-2-oxoglutarate aldolase/2-dehydro-3-deoxy-phosphogluconate aldolase [Xylocopilactobacillus apis]BDR57428.1 2-dehydro-3-deoxyphosphooctonate aldolase [Xylocopilactobacillus apis]